MPLTWREGFFSKGAFCCLFLGWEELEQVYKLIEKRDEMTRRKYGIFQGFGPPGTRSWWGNRKRGQGKMNLGADVSSLATGEGTGGAHSVASFFSKRLFRVCVLGGKSMMGMRGRDSYWLAKAVKLQVSWRGAHEPVCPHISLAELGSWGQDQGDQLQQARGECKLGDEVEKSPFWANQPRDRKGAARLGDHGASTAKNLWLGPYVPPGQNSLQWHYYHKWFSISRPQLFHWRSFIITMVFSKFWLCKIV